ncbi:MULTISPECIES: hypothetical protein [Leptospira]|uniref:Uncharacterized protein n=1 Tax=Leptospira santarosai serovar Shermani str. LT 821 TaxID=758847 RepID=K8Y114_9LEPT|nr:MULTISPECIES: hypothetical protein [Leptospira]ASV11516.1 hypothetical protein B2G51_06860 [Leptospira santarosai]AVV80120.1 Uncharacterized protein XB15_02371 [Leptospira santarosai]EKS09670.1 hypothetical protein LEP1GSC071_1250 [Leptospira santarosai str. JET]EKT86741.1 hypothetical protein LSS_10808 [Leptospira santarosai serovar Shermani str. LT 821]EMJ49641.1 hypothetical protein LEP1GSC169_2747 [Leptospira santarosai str. HAI1349]
MIQKTIVTLTVAGFIFMAPIFAHEGEEHNHSKDSKEHSHEHGKHEDHSKHKNKESHKKSDKGHDHSKMKENKGGKK